MLNLPDQIAKFGPLGIYWDRNFERFIQGPKKVLKSVRKNPLSLMTKMRILQAFSFMQKIRKDLGLDVSVSHDKRYMGVYIFPSREAILDRYTQGRCLSGFVVFPEEDKDEDSKYEIYCPYSTGRQSYSVVVLRYDPRNVRTNGCGLNYSQLVVVQTDGTVQMEKNDLRRPGVIADKYCLMLPYSRKNERFQFNYSIITHEYDVLRQDGEIGDNELCQDLFSRNNTNHF